MSFWNRVLPRPSSSKIRMRNSSVWNASFSLNVTFQVKRTANKVTRIINLTYYLLKCIYFSFLFLPVHEQYYSKMVNVSCVYPVFYLFIYPLFLSNTVHPRYRGRDLETVVIIYLFYDSLKIARGRSGGRGFWVVGLERPHTLDRGFESRSGHGCLSFSNVCRKPMAKKNPKVHPKPPSRDMTYMMKRL
jgi:hypothetical protein